LIPEESRNVTSEKSSTTRWSDALSSVASTCRDVAPWPCRSRRPQQAPSGCRSTPDSLVGARHSWLLPAVASRLVPEPTAKTGRIVARRFRTVNERHLNSFLSPAGRRCR
jgi:hypothetical protein